MATHVNQPDCACGLCRAQNSNLADAKPNVTTTAAPRQLGRDYHHGNPWHNRTPQLDRSPRQE